jgi:calcium-translocating P-type ATPase
LSLAYSVGQMMKEKQLVRNVSACEVMGAITTICSDKTGTLTENKMTVVTGYIGNKYYPQEKEKVTLPDASELNPEVVELIKQGICINSTAHLAKEKLEPNDPRLKDPKYVLKTELIGNKTEAASLKFVQERWGNPYMDYRNKYSDIVDRKPFSSQTKKMSTIIVNDDGDHIIHVKGASELLVEASSRININGTVSTFTKEIKTEILQRVSQIASKGIRTLCYSYQNLGKDLKIHQDSDLIFLCLLGIEDPLRIEVPESVRKCKQAGIKVRMVTGDNVLTAQKISEECGIYDGIPELYKVMEGPDFREIAQSNPSLLPTVVRKLQVLARSSPEDKLTLVNALQAIGEIVAVTGDGTNDAPAMKNAAVGLAMGSGTQVAKEASDIIIQDDNFATILTACKWGRGIYENIRKFLQFQLTVNVVALSLVLITSIGSVIQNKPSSNELPLTAIQLLWVNLIMNSFAALGLSTEKPSRNLLDRPPFKASDSIITPYMMAAIITQSTMQLAILIPLYYFGETIGLAKPFYFADNLVFTASQTNKTMVFNTFVFLQLFNQINARKIYKSGLYSHSNF